MPSIKLKKKTAEYLAEKEREKNEQASKQAEAEAPSPTKASPKKQEQAPVNFLKVEILTDKRKRTVPAAEQKLLEWIDDNLMEKEDVHVSLPSLYDYYAEYCILNESNVVDIPIFNKYIRDKFDKNFGIQEGSAIKGLVRETKKKEKKPRVQGETLSLKLKDIIQEIMKEAGNPRKGIRFLKLKTHIATKYPALRVDLYPEKLKSALERGARYGQVEVVRGIGKSGFYRLPGPPDKEEEEPQEKKKVKKEEKVEGEEGEDKEEAPSGAEEEGEKEEEEAKTGRRGKKRKAAETAEEKTKKEKKTKKKPKRKKEIEHRSESQKHADPKILMEVLPLAVTYMSEPKDASVGKIKKFIAENYRKTNLEGNRLKKTLETGIEKGYWDRVSGTSGGTGSFRLILDEYNPRRSDNMVDMVCQALVATHEPKIASALSIKKYIMQYHSDTFNIEARPSLFKKGLEKAVAKNVLRQVTGLGASGSFQLVKPFTPSPTILAGVTSDDEESDSDYGSDTSSEEEDEEIEDKGKVEMYVIRKTKSGRTGRLPVTIIARKRHR